MHSSFEHRESDTNVIREYLEHLSMELDAVRRTPKIAPSYASFAVTYYAHMLGRYGMPYTANISYGEIWA